MRILFLSNFYPPHEIGGYEQWCQEVRQGLQARGHNVQVLASRHGVQSEKECAVEDGVTRSLHLQADITYYRPNDFFLKRPGQLRANLRELKKSIDQFHPEVILVWGMWNLSLKLPYWAERLMPGRVAYFIASYWPMDLDPHTSYWRLPGRRPVTELVKRPLRALALSSLHREGYPPHLRFEHAVCCSQFVRDKLVQVGKLPPRAGLLYGGINPEPYLGNIAEDKNCQEKPLRLLYFGRLIHDKGVHTAIQALAILKQRGLADRVELTILGDGHPEYKARLQSMVMQTHDDNRVHFVAWVPKEEIPDWLKRFDVYLFTSIWPEPMARSVMEAMAAGLLVIGSEVGGQSEMLVNGENALTFKAEDAAGLADHIISVLEDPSLRLRLARSGQDMVLRKFTLTRMVDDIESYLSKVSEATPVIN
ncbi:MAG: glycosyltransferase family 4 protein [Anaerolineales bacterium]|jgi:glycosyltransferase involved in cell wall biosynthesis